MTLYEFINNPELVAKYQKWIHEDIGIIVCSVLQETYCRPTLPDASSTNNDTTSICLGKQAGAWEILDALRDLNGQMAVEQEGPEATYGVNQVQKEGE